MSAIFSPCNRYRYELRRQWGHNTKNVLCFCLVNPSKAGAIKGDTTTSKCTGFAKVHGYDGICLINLYAFCATDPMDMKAQVDPIGPDNDGHLRRVAQEFRSIICAWGVNAYPDRVRDVMRIFTVENCYLSCLGVTKDGHPRHPVRLSYMTPLQEYRIGAT